MAPTEWLRATAKGLFLIPPRSLRRDAAVGAALFGACAVLYYLKELVLPGQLALTPFFPGLVAVAILCRLPVALGYVIVSALVAAALWDYENSSYVAAVAGFIYVVIGALIVALIEGLKDAYGQIALREKQLSTVNRELAHRIRNLFQVANTIVMQSIGTAPCSKDIQAKIAGRFRALGAAQTISHLGDDDVSLARLVEVTVAPLAPGPNRLLATGPSTTIPAKAVTMLTLVLYELGTNALKYGAWSNQKGMVSVQWKRNFEKLTLNWIEREGPLVVVPTRMGAGSTLIQNAISSAVVDFRLEPDGAKCRIEFSDKRFCADANDEYCES
jgi:two-component sensor histidine kinase